MQCTFQHQDVTHRDRCRSPDVVSKNRKREGSPLLKASESIFAFWGGRWGILARWPRAGFKAHVCLVKARWHLRKYLTSLSLSYSTCNYWLALGFPLYKIRYRSICSIWLLGEFNAIMYAKLSTQYPEQNAHMHMSKWKNDAFLKEESKAERIIYFEEHIVNVSLN